MVFVLNGVLIIFNSFFIPLPLLFNGSSCVKYSTNVSIFWSTAACFKNSIASYLRKSVRYCSSSETRGFCFRVLKTIALLTKGFVYRTFNLLLIVKSERAFSISPSPVIPTFLNTYDFKTPASTIVDFRFVRIR